MQVNEETWRERAGEEILFTSIREKLFKSNRAMQENSQANVFVSTLVVGHLI